MSSSLPSSPTGGSEQIPVENKSGSRPSPRGVPPEAVRASPPVKQNAEGKGTKEPKDQTAVAATSGSPSSSSSSGENSSDSNANENEANLEVSRDWYSTMATFVAGGVAGAASRTLTAPLDRVKIIVQEGYLINAPKGTTLYSRKNARLIDVARLIWSDGGLKAFWRGNLINCIKAGPEFALVFSLRRYFSSLYEDCVGREKQRMKASAKRYDEHEVREHDIREREREERMAMTGTPEEPDEEDLLLHGKEDSDHPDSPEVAKRRKAEQLRASAERKHAVELEASIFTPPFNRLGCLSHVPRLVVNCTIGSAAGLGAQAVVYPLEVIKTRVVVSKSSEFKGGVREVVQHAYRTGGIREFYRGFLPNMVGIVVYRGLEMGIYSSIQQAVMLYRMQRQHMTRHDAALTTGEVGMTGMVASIVSQTVSYPFNVVRTRLQTQGSNGREKAYTGMVDCMVKMVRSKGVTALFSGLMANYLKAVPASTCAFMVFEKTQSLLLGDD